MNAARKRFCGSRNDARGMLFVSSGLGGMSGAQPKAGNISGVVSVIAEINPKAAQKNATSRDGSTRCTIRSTPWFLVSARPAVPARWSRWPMWATSSTFGKGWRPRRLP